MTEVDYALTGAVELVEEFLRSAEEENLTREEFREILRSSKANPSHGHHLSKIFDEEGFMPMAGVYVKSLRASRDDSGSGRDLHVLKIYISRKMPVFLLQVSSMPYYELPWLEKDAVRLLVSKGREIHNKITGSQSKERGM